ncbi:hypothetical protein BCR42DRAFT_421792 [Absidia repens]|uniref:Uncharacterized protein n=1 Tax=Absidia repens TaxID=90262 RepID=A0A1X2I802_9FUNG|nr:hypothetical protein BCR42DRAFT_421792 [Absidia repens]
MRICNASLDVSNSYLHKTGIGFELIHPLEFHSLDIFDSFVVTVVLYIMISIAQSAVYSTWYCSNFILFCF